MRRYKISGVWKKFELRYVIPSIIILKIQGGARKINPKLGVYNFNDTRKTWATCYQRQWYLNIIRYLDGDC